MDDVAAETHKTAAPNAPNRPRIRSSGLGDRVCETSKHFRLTSGHIEIGCLLLTSLGQVEKEKDELRDSSSQLQCREGDR